MSQENLQIVRGIYEATARRDIPAMVNALDPKVEWRLADNWIYTDRNPLIGPQAAIVEGPLSRIAVETEITGCDRTTAEGRTISEKISL